MKRIIRIGMDVHSTNYTLCAMEPIIGEDDRILPQSMSYQIIKIFCCLSKA